MKMITGFGDYKINSNSLMNMNPPPMVNSGNSSTIVRHREYLGDIYATEDFTLSKYPINPGLSTMFPWLSAIAPSYEQYRFRGIICEFKSTSSDAVLSSDTSSALGTVIMATQYDALDQEFSSKQEMENYEYATSSKPSRNFIHPIECAKNQTVLSNLYVRNDFAPGDTDLRFYDLGIFNVATVGMQADGGNLGELWVTYEVEFFKPKIQQNPTYGYSLDHYRISGADGANPLGTSHVQLPYSTPSSSIVSNIYYFDPTSPTGQYVMLYFVRGTAASLVFPAVTFAFATPYSLFSNGGASTTLNSGSQTIMMLAYGITVTTPGAQILFGSAGTLPTSTTSCDLIIFHIYTSLFQGKRVKTIKKFSPVEQHAHRPKSLLQGRTLENIETLSSDSEDEPQPEDAINNELMQMFKRFVLENTPTPQTRHQSLKRSRIPSSEKHLNDPPV
jgi:hypothetical protein